MHVDNTDTKLLPYIAARVNRLVLGQEIRVVKGVGLVGIGGMRNAGE